MKQTLISPNAFAKVAKLDEGLAYVAAKSGNNWVLPSGKNAVSGDYIVLDGVMGHATASITGGSTEIVSGTNWTAETNGALNAINYNLQRTTDTNRVAFDSDFSSNRITEYYTNANGDQIRFWITQDVQIIQRRNNGESLWTEIVALQSNKHESTVPTKATDSLWTSGNINAFRKGSVVTFKLNATVFSAATQRTTFATLPVGYRPVTEVGFRDDANAVGFIISTDGSVKTLGALTAGTYWGSVTYVCDR